MNREDRHKVIRMVAEDLPKIHSEADGSVSVWGAKPDCYRFMAQHALPVTKTLETGLGISTILFAAWGTDHTCVVSEQAEVDRCIEYMNSRGIPHDTVRFVVGTSDTVLPQMQSDPVDLYFIDGGHGYPIPIVDWYYGTRFMRPGSELVVDDVELPQVRDYLIPFLERDPRWKQMARTRYWAAYRLLADPGLAEDWRQQPFLGVPWTHRPAGLRVMAALGSLKQKVRRL